MEEIFQKDDREILNVNLTEMKTDSSKSSRASWSEKLLAKKANGPGQIRQTNDIKPKDVCFLLYILLKIQIHLFDKVMVF